jgi:uncharacterized protein
MNPELIAFAPRRAAAPALPMLRGHAAVFNDLSVDLGGFREKIAPGAFAGTLNDDVRALWNHNWDVLFGRTTSGTLRLAEDKIGLATEIDPPDTQGARDLLALVERRDVTQMSFGFSTIKDMWEKTPAGDVVRTLLEVKLYDVSGVAAPAYPQTDLEVVRAVRAQLPSHQERASIDHRRRRLRLAELELRSDDSGPAREKATVKGGQREELRRIAEEIRTTGRRITRRRNLDGEMQIVSSIVPGRDK